MQFNRFRKLFINFSFRSAANLISKIIGLITLPIITRSLGPEAYGNYNLVMVIVQYTAIPVSLLGLRSYGIRELASNRKEDGYALCILSMQFSIAIFAVLISLIITFFFFKSNSLIYSSILIGYIIVFSNALNLEFYYVAKKNLIFPTIARMLGQVFYVFGVILFIKDPNDVPILVFFAALTPTIGGLIQLIKFHLNTRKVVIRLTLNQALQTLKKTYKLGISANLEGFVPTIPQFLIPIMLSSYSFGIFSGGYKVYSILAMFYVTFFYALAPYIVKLSNYNEKIRRKYHLLLLTIISFFSVLIGVILFLWGEPIVILILGKSFGESIIIFKAISITLIPITPISMLLGNILVYSEREKYYLIALIISGVIILVLSPILLLNYREVGAVYATALSVLSGILVMGFFYFKTE